MPSITSGIRSSISSSDLVVVGSGFFGLTVAQLAASSGYSVTVLEKRDHPGGNAWSEVDAETGIEVHKYGSHLFHTSNQEVWEFAHQFTSFTNYQHHVWAVHNHKSFSLPINLQTIQSFYGTALSPNEAKELIAKETLAADVVNPKNLEEKAMSLIGRPLYEAFIRGYTQKQWQTDPKKLPAEIITRLPVRFNFNSRYFSDLYEGLPTQGYFSWLNRMADHSNINLFTGVDYFDVERYIPQKTHVVYTGPIDRFFNYSCGRLSWRTLDFETEILDLDDFQGTAVVNHADLETPYTRIHEFKHLHPEREHLKGKTLISREFSRSATRDDEPYYPVNTAEDRAKLGKYRALSQQLTGVTFGGRLGSYQYLDMHMAIASALSKYRNEISQKLASNRLLEK
jgi:UDP-galactopyranose mutase